MSFNDRKKLLILITIILMVLSGRSQALEVTGRLSKEKPLLIEFGQTTPDARHMRKNVAYWEEYLPFDGVVMRVHPDKYAGRYGGICADALDPNYWSIAWSAFSNRTINPADYAGAIEDLRNTPFKKFKHNFLLLNSHPYNNFEPDWFDDDYWQKVCYNVAVLARIAKQGGCKGIMFDDEMYPTNQVWNYNHLKQAHPDRPQDFETYRQQVRKRGREFIKAINAEFPDIEFCMLFGSSLMHARMAGRNVVADLEDVETHLEGEFKGSREVLIAPFLDGLIEAAAEETKIIDMYELSYYYKTAEQFQNAQKIVKEDCRIYSMIPKLYAEKIGLGLGLYPTRKDPRRFKYDELAKSTELAMKYTDKYVWIWSEDDSFWVKQGESPILPDYAMTDVRFGAPMLLTYPATKKSVLRNRYRSADTEYIGALFEGKKKALEQYEKIEAKGKRK